MDQAWCEWRHETVLLNEAADALVLQPGGTYIDGTFGRGGHSRALLTRLAPSGRLIAFDRDPYAIEAAAQINDARFLAVQASFASMREVLTANGVDQVAGVLFDLGISSPQLDDPARGFSFRFDGPLDMRMDPTHGESAAQWLAQATQQELTQVIRDYGEERFAVQIAKAIIARRAESGRLGPLNRTGELARIVARVVKTREKGQHPATRTFQALRIHINQELAQLRIALDTTLSLLQHQGRLVVISFHSLEDRIVKRFIQSHARRPVVDRRLPIRDADLPASRLRQIGRVRPSAAQIAANPRARSAVMRIAERVRREIEKDV